MLIYRKQVKVMEPARELARIRTQAAAGTATQTLLELGELEAAVADAAEALAPAFRGAALRAAEFYFERTADRRERLARALEELAALPLPARAEAGVAEGYAYYALYPEMYREAARRFYAESKPERAAVLGIRSIGTSLSAVVAATLEGLGCRTASWTVRPRGHPFQRTLKLSAEVEAQLRAEAGAWFLVVDEGPGLSGSSMASVAAKLAELGVADDRIVLFPSWTPDGSAFLSAEARERWGRHRKYCAGFEEVWPRYGAMEDLSAGGWRRLFWKESAWPAAQPQHERRKYRQGGTLLKFAGLGRYGAGRRERACRLAAAGFTPRVLGLDNGFLATEFVEGRPLSPGDGSPELPESIARYLAFLKRHCPGERTVGFDELLEMIRVNAGEECADAVSGLRSPVEDTPAVAIDGRMLPHEFLATPSGLVKTDALDHHDDHFLPGCQDVAWDLAAAGIEFGLNPRALTARYERLSGDRGLGRRLAFHRTAYLAFRLGYAVMAERALAGTPEAARFAREARRYRALTSAGRR